jgi:DNA-binding response OmpR family regulator
VTAVLRRHRPTPQRPTPLRRATDFLPVEAGNASIGTHLPPRRRASDVGPEAAGNSSIGTHQPPRRRASDVGPEAAGNSSTEATVATGADHGRNDGTHVVRHGPLVVEVEGRTALLEGVELVLTRTEFDLLEALAGAPRRVWTRKALLTKVWGSEWPMDEHLVEVHIGNLRRKLGDKGREPRFIRTVRGVGYRMAPAEEVA